MNTYSLTGMEKLFINAQLKENDCGAKTASDLLEDNFSCKSMEDYLELAPNFTAATIGGFLSSLEKKDVIYRDEDEGRPVVWWVTEAYLESLEPSAEFTY